MNWNEWTKTNAWMIMNDLSTSSWKSGPNPSVFDGFYVKSSSRYSFVHILSTWSSKKVVRDCQFLTVSMWNRALATVSCAFCRPHLQKVVRDCHFLTICMWSTTWWRCGRQMTWSSRYSRAHTLSTSLSTSSSKSAPRLSVFDGFFVKSSSRYSLVRILSATFRIEARNRGNGDPPAATTDGHFTRKNAGFCFQPWIHAFPIAHTSQLLDDDVIDMMMWLTWWLRWCCGCHDGETASHWQSSVTRKFPD